MGTAQEEFCSGIRTFSKTLAGAMKTADSKVARAMEKSLSEVTNRYLEKEEFAYPKGWPLWPEAMEKPPPDLLPEAWENHIMVWTGESDQDQRSEARRWLDERVEEVRVLAWR